MKGYPMDEFQIDLEALINKHGLEDGSNTPDFILAEFLVNCLQAFNLACEHRRKWYHNLEATRRGGEHDLP